MSVYLKKSSGEILSNDYLNMTTGDGSYTSTRDPVSEGKWYFEFTHHLGDQYHIACFRSAISFACFYPQNILPSSVLYNSGMNMNVSSNYYNLNLPNVDPIHTIGIGINLHDKLFLIQSKEILLFFSFDVPSDTKFYPLFTEATSPQLIFSDIISVNFGDKIFSYIIPEGFKPWSNSLYYSVSFYRRMSNILHFFLFTIDLLLDLS